MSSPEARRQERFWNHLLTIISRGNVVPVVGENLLTVPGTPEQTVYQGLASRYAELSGISPSEGGRADLSSIVRSHPEFVRNPHDIYHELGEEYEEWKPEIPEALRALARIRHFHLFISTTFDDLLERALNEERFGGKPRTELLAYSPKSVPDDDRIAAQLATGHPLVFQIFGHYKTPLQFALTEGDKVEYIHALQSAEYSPRRIFSELYDRPLLMLGTGFPDWLTRMLLRMLRRIPLDHREVPKQYLADSHVTDDAMLRSFLEDFATNTELIDHLSPTEFVTELATRWEERFGGEAEVAPPIPATAPRPMPKNAIFISYCATDASGRRSRDDGVAQALRDSLESAGMDVWLDKDQLQGGDEFERKIQRYINTCALFVPLISETTESRTDGFFRKEWGWALKRLPEFTGSSRQFLFPVLIDQLNPYEAKVPEEFKRVQFASMMGAGPEPQLIHRLRWIYDQARNGGD